MYEVLQKLGRCMTATLHYTHVIETEVFNEKTMSIEITDFDIDKTFYDNRFDGVDDYFSAYIDK